MADHAERAHSIWSPSAYDGRWSLCPASALACKDIERQSSDAADRGTWMHERTEALLRDGKVDKYDTTSPYNTEANWDDILYAYTYLNELIEVNSLLDKPIIQIEERLHLPKEHFDVFGTCDFNMYVPYERHLIVADEKFGHTEVEAKDNGQMMIYAKMRATELILMGHEISTVTLIIIQPAVRDKIKVHSMPYEALLQWYGHEFIPKLSAAKQEDAPFIPGEKQCKWCPKSGDCEAQTNYNLDALAEFDSVPTVEDLPKRLEACRAMEAFIEGTRKQALAVLMNGGSIEGYKLVRSITKRRWVDEEKAEKWLAARKIPKDERTVTKIIGIPDAEKKLNGILKNNPRLQTNFEKLYEKPEGRVVMALADDKREEVILEDPLQF